MKKEIKLGDKLYSNTIGPTCLGTVTSIKTNKLGQQFIEITLDKPILKFAGYANQFSKLN